MWTGFYVPQNDASIFVVFTSNSTNHRSVTCHNRATNSPSVFKIVNGCCTSRTNQNPSFSDAFKTFTLSMTPYLSLPQRNLCQKSIFDRLLQPISEGALYSVKYRARRSIIMMNIRHTASKASRFSCARWTCSMKERARNDTIFALSTAQGRAGVGIIRVSGPDATQCVDALSKQTKQSALAPRMYSTLKQSPYHLIAIILSERHFANSIIPSLKSI